MENKKYSAYVETTKRAYNKIIGLLLVRGFAVVEETGRFGLIFSSNDSDNLAAILVELKYRYPKGYVKGWTLGHVD
jgi:hypothetical protein